MQNVTRDVGEGHSAGAATGRRVNYRSLLWVGPLAAIVAALGCGLIYAVASAVGAIPQSVLLPGPTGQGPLTLGSVIVMSVIGSLGAAIVFALIGLFSRRPVGLFRVVALVVLVLSLGTPITVSGAPVAMIVSLISMHVVVAAVSVGLLTTLARRK